MNSGSEPGLVGDIQRDNAAKARALSQMLRIVTAGKGAELSIREYLEASGGLSADVYVAACDSLRETWTNTFQPPSPGHIRQVAQRFEEKTRSQIRDELTAQRLSRARMNRATPEKIRAELANPQFVDPDPAIEAKRLASLRRMVDGQPREMRTRKRGDGGLQPLGVVVEGVL